MRPLPAHRSWFDGSMQVLFVSAYLPCFMFVSWVCGCHHTYFLPYSLISRHVGVLI